MKPYRPVPYKGEIPYAVLSQIEAYTEHYRVNYMDREDPDKGFHHYQHNELVEVLIIGGMNNYFLAYAYPPAGFEIARPEDIETLVLWQGFILELVNYEPTYRLDTATFREGYAAFKNRKTELGY